MFHALSAQIVKSKTEAYTFVNRDGTEIPSEIGTFEVPENRSTPNGRSIKLSFVRFKSTNSSPANPIVYLAGGPGGSGIETARGPRFELFMALREVADVIAFDQRGTGKSNQIPSCKETFAIPLNEPGSASVYLEKMQTASQACINFWKSQGIDVAAYNTRENANDLDDLRQVLGVEKLNLWGISYGSHLAFAYTNQYPDRIDRMVLAGLEGPDQTIKRPKYNQEFLAYLAKKVKEDEAASKFYPDVLGSMKTVFERLEKAPVFAKAKDPRSGETYEVAISKFDLQLVTSYFLLKNPEDARKLPYLFKQMEAGDFSEIAPTIAFFKQYAGQRGVDLMPLIMDIMSGVSQDRWKQIQEEEKIALLGRTTNFPFPDIGASMGLPDLGTSFRQNPVSDVPSLFFSGTLDGRTYLPAAKELLEGFSQGAHVILDGAGHDMFLSTEKVKLLMLDFFSGKTISSQTISIDMPQWVLPK